jgi:hypothetical protein
MYTKKVFLGLLTTTTAALAAEPRLATDKPVGELELVATFDGPMPTGVTVSQKGRVFVNYPRWGDPVTFTVAEWKDGKAVAYPDAGFATYDKARPAETLVSVLSVVVDPADRLWILDTGSIAFGPVIPGGAKLVGVDLATNKVFQCPFAGWKVRGRAEVVIVGGETKFERSFV